MQHLNQLITKYADLLIRIGVNLQPAQSLNIVGEIAHRDFIVELVTCAYKLGAKYVHVDWVDPRVSKARYLHSQPEYLDSLPEFFIGSRREFLDQSWGRLALTGEEFPDIFDDVDPNVMRRANQTRARLLKFYMTAQMSNQIQWCVAAVPTKAWAKKVYPALDANAATEKLWGEILRLVRVDLPDPIAAWQQHDENLRKVREFMAQKQVRTLKYLDTTPAEDGLPRTQLTVGLTDKPVWVAASSVSPNGVRFLPNMPTEEVFTSPHRLKAEGYLRLSKPAFPFGREVRDVYIRIANGEVVEWRASHGNEALSAFFDIKGARHLGELALVDVRSPVNQAGVVFFDGLLDENAVCHIAFGSAYTEGMEGAETLSEAERIEAGLNVAEAHEDMMIGTDTLDVTGICADGSEVIIMRKGQFVF
jgi:aminopeptidase